MAARQPDLLPGLLTHRVHAAVLASLGGHGEAAQVVVVQRELGLGVDRLQIPSGDGE